ncbi:MAG: hypothetical protein OXN19_22315, partial [Caldilineaceae bacterium]|nr:hypothetical protein [Caldilineaceae bacterium]
EPVLPAPEADALSTELRGRSVERTIPQRLPLQQTTSSERRLMLTRAGAAVEPLCGRGIGI